MKNLKRTAGIVMCLAMTIAMAACGKNPDGPTSVIVGKVDSGNTNVNVQVDTGDVKTGDVKTGETDTNVTVNVGNIVNAGYTFVYNNVNVYIDCDASEVVEKLGKYDYYEAPSCAFDGLDKVYTYSSFEIDTYPEGDKDYISAIIFKDDMVETQEGICIGETKDNVEGRYGSPTSMDDRYYEYEKGDMRLRFIFDADGYVISIEYLSNRI